MGILGYFVTMEFVWSNISLHRCTSLKFRDSNFQPVTKSIMIRAVIATCLLNRSVTMSTQEKNRNQQENILMNICTSIYFTSCITTNRHWVQHYNINDRKIVYALNIIITRDKICPSIAGNISTIVQTQDFWHIHSKRLHINIF